MRMLYWPDRSPLKASRRLLGQRPQILKTGRGIKDFEPFIGLPGEALKSLHCLAICEPSRALIAVADDHVSFEDKLLTMYVKRKSKW